MRHRYELTRETSRRKNKLISICDELFPEFTAVMKDPPLPSALAVRKQFPTPSAVASATLQALVAARPGHHPSDAKLAQLQEFAKQSIGVKNITRQRTLIFEQNQLISELQLLQQHLDAIDAEIALLIERSREGCILTSIPGIGPIQAASIIAAIGHIDNFTSAAKLRSYFGWAPTVAQTGISFDRAHLTKGGLRTMRQIMFLVACNAIRMETEWASIYQRLVPLKWCWDERTKSYKGRRKVIGRIAGQIISTIYTLLKQDVETLRKYAGKEPPEPALYDPEVHKAHRSGQYHTQKPKPAFGEIIHLPSQIS